MRAHDGFDPRDRQVAQQHDLGEQGDGDELADEQGRPATEGQECDPPTGERRGASGTTRRDANVLADTGLDLIL